MDINMWHEFMGVLRSIRDTLKEINNKLESTSDTEKAPQRNGILPPED